MDFASLMSAQIAKAKSETPGDSTTASKKYTKRSEIEAERDAAYRRKQEELEASRAAKLEQKRKLEDEEEERNLVREQKKQRLAEESKRRREEEEEEIERKRRKKLGLPALPKKSSREETPLKDGQSDMPEEELSIKLREWGQPVKLFGETHRRTLRRYWRLVEKSNAPKLSDGPIPTILEMVPEAEMKVDKAKAKDEAGRKYLFRQLASYFTMVLKEWEVALAGRTAEVKASGSGKAAYNSMVQARENLRPLFKKMEKNELEESILLPVVGIVQAAQERRYVDANDAYLTVSIGKAAWPIGVTMVGIHERSAREKLHESDNAAHIMSDETTRKYLQSIKRCLSFAQTRWPPDDQLQLMG
ncbi:Prp18 domain-containing protein [Aulographum hederae CBS 113979]|uniref:Pre-mRNA-splicing factor 18 n=1 Tax=Aulographum hederae CBS 113979 TaxID=1176131 RepID=A0A6G1GKQ9_9PEZI|nr:Prp18 domain-containing protein [Aulographum hederae CBS 113979]